MLQTIYEFHALMENKELPRRVFTKQQAQIKAEHYCVYQERSQYEMRNKLYEWGLHQHEVEQLISILIEQNFLNEERYTLAYTLGKFRIKGWGKIKIKQSLKLKQVPEKLILKSLQKIDPDDYYEKLKLLVEKKDAILKEKDPFKRKYKLIQFALMKGYERDLITDVLNNNKLS